MLIPPFINFHVLLKKSIKKVLNKSIDLIGSLSQEISCRYHVDEDFINKYQWLQTKMLSLSTFSFETLIITSLNK